jgi:diguanylate cyclase (GGDEF)-like protein
VDQPRSALLARLSKSVSGDLDPVLAGCLLLAVTGLAVLGSVPLIHADGHTRVVLAVVSGVMCTALLLAMIIDWSRLPARATLAFPAGVCAALILISLDTDGLVAPLVGLLTLCFAFTGLTQRPGTSVILLPLASAAFVVANGGWSRPITVRLVVAMFVWTLLSELLSQLTGKQARMALALRSAAHTDVLTGVANRRDLDMRLALAQPGDVILLCDIDHFKKVNDERGHAAGDRVLADFGAILRMELRDLDYCARYGGEEFAVLLPASDAAAAQRVLGRLRRAWGTLQPQVTFSAGIAVCRKDRLATETLAAADQALYAAKDAGRNTERVENLSR